jgi:hypothetical protein
MMSVIPAEANPFNCSQFEDEFNRRHSGEALGGDLFSGRKNQKVEISL